MAKKTVSDKQFLKNIEAFEKNNPAILKAMKAVDMSMKEYEQIIRSLDPITTYTGNSTSTSQK